MVKDGAIVRQCFELVNSGIDVSFREHVRENSGDREAWLIPVRIVAVRLVAAHYSSLSSCLNDGAYSAKERARIARRIDRVCRLILAGRRKLPAILPIPSSGVHRHRAEPRRSKQDDPKRFADCGVHRVREFSYDKRSLKFGQLLTDVD